MKVFKLTSTVLPTIYVSQSYPDEESSGLEMRAMRVVFPGYDDYSLISIHGKDAKDIEIIESDDIIDYVDSYYESFQTEDY